MVGGNYGLVVSLRAPPHTVFTYWKQFVVAALAVGVDVFVFLMLLVLLLLLVWCCCFFRKAHFGLLFFSVLRVSLNVFCVSLAVIVPSEGERHQFVFVTAFALTPSSSSLLSSHASYDTRPS